jgi:Cohesin domain
MLESQLCAIIPGHPIRPSLGREGSVLARLAKTPTRYRERPAARSELIAIVHRARELTGASGAAVGLTVNNGQEIECCASSGPSAPLLGRAPLLEESLTALSISCGKQLRFDRTSTGGGAVVVTPIGRENQIIGVLAVFADTTHLFSKVSLASLKAAEAQITEILCDEYGFRQDQVLDLSDASAGEVTQPKPPASVRLPLPDEITEAPASEPRTEDTKRENSRPVQLSLATLEALAAQPEPSLPRKTIWIAAMALVVIGGGTFWAFRAKADQQALVPAGFHPSATHSAGGPATLSVDPASLTARQGSTFALNIVLSRGQDISSVPVLLHYDPVMMRVVSVSDGEFLSRDGHPVVLTHRDDSSRGTLRIHAQRLQGSPGLSGEGTAFRLVFMAMERGSGRVSIVPEDGLDTQVANKPAVAAQALVTVK